MNNTPINYRQMRINSKLSLQEVATLTGYSRGHVHNVETGVASPSEKYTQAFLRCMGQPNQPHADTRASKAKLLNELYTQLTKAEDLNTSLSRLSTVAANLHRANKTIVDQVHALIDQPPIKYDIATADEETQIAISNHIIVTIVGLLQSCNFQGLPPEIKHDALLNLLEQVETRLG